MSKEYTLGYDQLPSVYSSYFHLPLQTVLSKTVLYLKRWFLIIRSAREAYDPSHLEDDFSSNGQLRKWIGLSLIP